MRRGRKRKMFLVAGILLVIVGVGMGWFYLPYSPTKNDFQKEVAVIMAENQLADAGRPLTAEDFSALPTAIQKYVEHCGYLGKPKMSCMKMVYHDVNFLQGRNGPMLRMDYIQYNFVNEPCRMAFIDSGLYGVPFEGVDYYQNGTGGMKGVLAKALTLFNQRGMDMDRSQLATFLAESLFVPSILLQDYITFEAISDFEVRATICYKGQTVSGIFTFNAQYEMVSFMTNDRAVTEKDGSTTYLPWSARCSNYQRGNDGILRPTQFQAVWHYSDEDLTYFDGAISEITYG